MTRIEGVERLIPTQSCQTILFRSCAEPDVDDCVGKGGKAGIDTCDSGCLCKRGFYRNSVGRCVQLAECGKCGKNMVRSKIKLIGYQYLVA